MRILIIEDEPLIRERLLRMCGELAGGRARFDAVPDLNLAGDRLQRNLYDGLLLDLNLGGEDGFELLRQMSKRETLSEQSQQVLEQMHKLKPSS